MEDSPRTPALLTVREIADALRVHPRTAYRLITDGSIRAIKIGSQWRVPEQALLEFIDSGWRTSVQKKKQEIRGQVQLNLPLDKE
ncbi:MAG: helix-turn-helix domain-containing protein [Proteobacteria bacterium]|nr:helix-turn-helix domain-containing protein [Pseudomonadota bacterium]MBU1612035.1 helix-turn-helix domain-containing protein [Pseudomonadota bacterium]